MIDRVEHFGWMVSPYTAKTRSFLRYAGVDFDDVAPTVWDLWFRIRRAVGAMVMPTVRLPDGRFIKDSSVIIDHFERLHPQRAITPATPRQRIASAVLEVYADEWLPLAALYYRWTRPDSAAFAVAEFGRNGAPWLPRPLQRVVGRKLAAQMQSYLPILGIDKETGPGIERMTERLIAGLDLVLARTPYILGQRPCLGDFALYGPLFAHLLRDPGSRGLFAQAAHVRAWIDRMEAPTPEGEFLADDEVPAPIEAILASAFAEQWVYLAALVRAIDRYVAANPAAVRVPRALGEVEVEVGGVRTRRKLITFAQWKLQRAHAAYTSVAPAERAAVDTWLDGLGGGQLRAAIAHPMVFVGSQLRLA